MDIVPESVDLLGILQSLEVTMQGVKTKTSSEQQLGDNARLMRERSGEKGQSGSS